MKIALLFPKLLPKALCMHDLTQTHALFLASEIAARRYLKRRLLAHTKMGPGSPAIGPILASLAISGVAAYAIAEGQMVYHFFGGRAPPHTNSPKWTEATRSLNVNKARQLTSSRAARRADTFLRLRVARSRMLNA